MKQQCFSIYSTWFQFRMQLFNPESFDTLFCNVTLFALESLCALLCMHCFGVFHSASVQSICSILHMPNKTECYSSWMTLGTFVCLRAQRKCLLSASAVCLRSYFCLCPLVMLSNWPLTAARHEVKRAKRLFPHTESTLSLAFMSLHLVL